MAMDIQTEFYKFRSESASARLTVWRRGEELIGEVSGVFSRIKRCGHATLVLNELIKFADEQKLELTLIASAYGPDDPKALTEWTLVNFYKKFGFEMDPGDGQLPFMMVRSPQ